MLVNHQYVSIKWNVSNKKYYESKGYQFTKYKDEIIVKVEDLSKNSRANIKAICEYCNDVYDTSFSNYNKSISTINKSCCSNTECMKAKREEILLFKYKVKNVSQLDDVRLKVKQTNLINLGVEYSLQSNKVREKRKETMLLRYGVENYTQTEEYLMKSRETSLRKYGVDSPNKSEIVQSKKNRTMYENGTTKTSRQQKYIHDLYGGELNYPVGKSMLDIAFLHEKIYIEYDGSGHDLCVKKDNLSQTEFDSKERKRYFALKHLGWKSMRIISNYDKLPKDSVLMDILKIGTNWIKEGHNWINFIIDENIIETSKGEIHYNYGEINKLAL